MVNNSSDMTGRKYNVGDKVLLSESIDINICGKVTTLPIGEMGVIDDVDEDELRVDFAGLCALTLDVSQVEPYDRSKRFLTKLAALLRECDVYLIAHKTDMPVSVYFKGSANDGPFAQIGREVNKGCGVVITADNIMGLRKE